MDLNDAANIASLSPKSDEMAMEIATMKDLTLYSLPTEYAAEY
jgi:hypothetical protein